ncbi:TPA: hypothetical protein DEP21_04470 [Patescibacteria group bacterium]|nr:hypothetical protein [Candidatus Gracilibacteria bacterium]
MKKEVKAEKDGTIKAIDMKLVNLIARTLGSPVDTQSGLYLTKKLGDKVKKNELVYIMYSNEQSKIDMALDILKEKKMYEIK